MGTKRLDRVNELLQREIASNMYRILTGAEVDLAAVTVTHVIASPDLRSARVLVSVMGDELEGKRVIQVLRNHRAEFQKAIAADVVLKFTPKLKFALDASLAQGDHVMQILDQLDAKDRAAREESEQQDESEDTGI
jgi:ribosome-binding factor A